MIMFTAVEEMTQEEVDELAPTENALSLLEVNSGPSDKGAPTKPFEVEGVHGLLATWNVQ